MGKTTIGDAFQQKKGDLYHYAEAVEVCLKADEDEIVHIENYGDISTLKESIEVKDVQQSLTLQSYQIWNTLKNWITNIEIFNQFDKLILLTTSPVIQDRQVLEWNILSGNDKLLALKKAKLEIEKRKNPSAKKIEIFEKVFTYSKIYSEKDLIDILSKFYICIKSVDSQKKYEELKKNESIKFLTANQRQVVLNTVIGIIFKNGLEGKSYWTINISELNRTIVSLCAKVKGKLPKLLKNYDEIKVEDYEHETFVSEMQRIKLDEWEVAGAIGDYCKTQDTIIKLLDENINYQEDLENFKYRELFGYLVRNKKIHELECNEKNYLQLSKKNYYTSLNKIHLLQLTLLDNENYFQRGNIHALVDEKKHRWLINEY